MGNFYKLILLIGVLLSVISESNAQIFIGNDTVMCQGNLTLNAQVTPHPGATVYQFTTIPYNPESYTGTQVTLSDDAVSGALPIGFTFCFIGNNYTQFYIGSNGWISFTAGQPTTFISQIIPSTNPSVPKNCIFAPWMDWDPSQGGQIFYKTVGTAPNRKLVVSWVNVPLWGGSCNQFTGTFQIVIEEGTNIVNNYIQNKPICQQGGSGGGSLFATQGVHDLTGTIAYTVPGRNNTQWTATNEGTQFFPTGPALYTVTWFNSLGAQIGTGNSVTVNPSSPTYFVGKVTYNCSGVIYYDTINVNVSPPVLANTTTVNVLCNGASTGSATANVLSGTPPYTYIWNTTPPQSTATASNLPAGIYSVTITDDKGCQAVRNAVVTQPAGMQVVINSNKPSCAGGNDGTATAVVVGGSQPLGYSWPNSQTTSTATGLAAGTYILTVTDNNGCTKTGSVTLTDPPAINIQLTTIQPVCNGSTGTITATVSGGASPYSYSWSGGGATTVKTGIAGSYTLTVTDSKGCIKTASATLTNPAALALSAIATPANCPGSASGSISLTVTNGTAPFTYNWSNNTTAHPAQNLLAGNYTVTVTDSKGCTATISTNVTSLPGISLTLTSTQAQCAGSATGTATVAVQNGNGPFTYNWSNNQSTATASNLSSGNYSVTVSDQNGCSATGQVTVTQPANLVANLTTFNILCNGANNGSAQVNPSGGLSPYTINWSTNQSGTTVSNLSAGIHSFTITDGAGCILTQTFSITEPQQIQATLTKNDISCFGGSDGSITATVSKGTPPYNYAWSNNQTGTSISNLTTGSYSITVTDINNCSVVASIQITQPAAISLTLAADSVSCNGGSDGKATSTISGGTAPYLYNWSNSQSSATATNLWAGQYTVTVTDSKGCSYSGSIFVEEPLAIQTSVTVVDEICIASNGSATVSASGGVAPYTYYWQNGGTSNTISAVKAGNYSVTITDTKGCVSTATAIIGNTGNIGVSVDKKDISCFGFNDGSLTANVTGGTAPVNYNWSNGDIDPVTSKLAPGLYWVTVSDIYGCKDSANAIITEPPLLELTLSATDASCYGLEDGEVISIVKGGTSPYQFSWSNLQYDPNLSNIAAGNYALTVTDTNGCIIQASVIINQPDEIIITMIGDTSIPFGNKVRLNTAVSPAGSYDYSWSPQEYLDNGYSASPLSAPMITTHYALQVTDLYTGCVVSDSVLVEVKDPRQFWIPSAFSPNGDGVNDVFIAKANNLEFFTMQIFNRWGELLFNVQDINQGWDGRYNGELQKMDTYIYKIYLVDEWGEGHFLAGNITLLR